MAEVEVTMPDGTAKVQEIFNDTVLSALPSTLADLNRQYEATFGLLVSGGCPPYETEYINGKFTIQRSHTLADISGYYRAFGLQVSTQHVERHDHIVLHLEFMAFLLGKEAEAVREDNDDHIAVCREAQQRFFREHLAWWSPAFAHLLAREAGDGFYGRIGCLFAALITSDRARYGLPAPEGTVLRHSILSCKFVLNRLTSWQLVATTAVPPHPINWCSLTWLGLQTRLEVHSDEQYVSYVHCAYAYTSVKLAVYFSGQIVIKRDSSVLPDRSIPRVIIRPNREEEPVLGHSDVVSMPPCLSTARVYPLSFLKDRSLCQRAARVASGQHEANHFERIGLDQRRGLRIRQLGTQRADVDRVGWFCVGNGRGNAPVSGLLRNSLVRGSYLSNHIIHVGM